MTAATSSGRSSRPRGCWLAKDVDEPACRADGVPVLRRASGGGTVLLGPGCLCFSLVLRYDRAPGLEDITVSYRHVLVGVVEVDREPC